MKGSLFVNAHPMHCEVDEPIPEINHNATSADKSFREQTTMPSDGGGQATHRFFPLELINHQCGVITTYARINGHHTRRGACLCYSTMKSVNRVGPVAT